MSLRWTWSRGLSSNFSSRFEDSLRKNCLYLDFFWSVFFRFWTEYTDLQSKSPNLVQIQENRHQKFSECRRFLGSDSLNNKTNQNQIFESNIIVVDTYQAKFYFL